MRIVKMIFQINRTVFQLILFLCPNILSIQPAAAINSSTEGAFYNSDTIYVVPPTGKKEKAFKITLIIIGSLVLLRGCRKRIRTQISEI